MKRAITTLLSFSTIFCFGQDKETDLMGSIDLLTIYEFGAFFDPGSDCEITTRKSYGYQTVWGTCTPLPKELRNNRSVYRKIKRKHGRKWQVDFQREVAACRKAQKLEM